MCGLGGEDETPRGGKLETLPRQGPALVLVPAVGRDQSEQDELVRDEVVLADLSGDPEPFAQVRRRRAPAAFPQLGDAHLGKDLRQDDEQASSARPSRRLVVDAVNVPIVAKVECRPPGEQERHGLLGRVVVKPLRQAHGQAQWRRGSGEVTLEVGADPGQKGNEHVVDRGIHGQALSQLGDRNCRLTVICPGRGDARKIEQLQRALPLERRDRRRGTKEKVTGVGGAAVHHLDQTEIEVDVGALGRLRSERLGLRKQHRRPFDSAS